MNELTDTNTALVLRACNALEANKSPIGRVMMRDIRRGMYGDISGFDKWSWEDPESTNYYSGQEGTAND